MSPSILFLILICLIVFPGPVKAEKCFGIVNETANSIRVFSKTGSMTYKEVPATSIDTFCCPAAAPLCFDKNDGTTKAKIVRIDPNGMDEWSGLTCRKLRIRPGQSVAVSLGDDGHHIACRFVDASTFVPKFETIDTDKDGRIDSEEARAINMNPDDFKVTDKNNDYYMDKTEYKNGFSKINIFKGVKF
jgi:hypothetical protein